MKDINEIDRKRENEKDLVSKMILLYCKKQHQTGELCEDCKGLEEYARLRSDKCPFMETKTFCAKCKVHCYKPEMREKIRTVMRFSGPRMLFYHPLTVLKHMIEDRRGTKK